MGGNMKIEVSPTKMSAFETCPKQFYLRYYKKEKAPKKIEHMMHVGSLVHKALEFLAEYPEFDYIDECVTKAISEIDIVPTQEMVKESRDMIKNWYSEDKFENELIASEYHFQTLIADDLVIMGYIDRVERIDENRIKVIDYKTGNQFYTLDDLKNSNQLIMYAMACYEEFGAENIVICYDMVRLNKQFEIGITIKDFEEKREHIKAIYKRMKAGENEAVISRNCAYCWYKHNCTEYKGFLSEILKIQTIEEIFEGDFEESIAYIKELESKKTIIEKHITEVKGLITTEMMSSGEKKIKYGKYTISLVSRNRKFYNTNDVIEAFSDDEDELKEVISVKNIELEKRIHSLSEEKRDVILDGLRVREGNPYLKISKKK